MQEKNLTYNDLPEALSQVRKDISFIKQFLIENRLGQHPDLNSWMNISELCNYLPDKPTKNTIYSWVQNRIIPFHKGPKILYFLKSEIDAWMKEGRKNSSIGPSIPPENHLKTNKKIKK
ncbi:MAG: helix-turn-helix domain-containing protein [Saprospiraceae bacterium]|nr:helix-turn-helix domain-containing protein [Candidatus Vicinibacter affinis]